MTMYHSINKIFMRILLAISLMVFSLSCTKEVKIPNIQIPTNLTLVEIEEMMITGNLAGIVVDPSGVGIRSVKVELFDLEKKVVLKSVETNKSGRFNFRNFPDGQYKVQVSLEGFNTVIYTVSLDSKLKNDLVLMTAIIN